jgi:hypothetical protein
MGVVVGDGISRLRVLLHFADGGEMGVCSIFGYALVPFDGGIEWWGGVVERGGY